MVANKTVRVVTGVKPPGFRAVNIGSTGSFSGSGVPPNPLYNLTTLDDRTFETVYDVGASAVAGLPSVVMPAYTRAGLIAYIQGNSHLNGNNSSTTVAVTLASTVAATDMVVVHVGWATTDNTDVVTQIKDDKNNTYTLVDAQIDVNVGGYKVMNGYCLNVTNAPQTITATLSIARTFASIVADEFAGIATASALGGHAITFQNSPAAATDSVTSGDITPAVSGDLIYGFTVNEADNGTTSSGTGFTQRQNVLSGVFVTESLIQAGAAAVAATFTPSTNNDSFITAVMAFKKA